MGRVYTLNNSVASFTGAGTLVEIGAATNTTILIRRITILQSSTETDDHSGVEWGTYTASGTGTNVAANAEVHDPGDAAFSGTAEDNHTVDIATGEVIKGRWGWSALAGLDYVFLEDSRLVIPGGGFFGLNFEDTITSATIKYAIEFEEIG